MNETQWFGSTADTHSCTPCTRCLLHFRLDAELNFAAAINKRVSSQLLENATVWCCFNTAATTSPSGWTRGRTCVTSAVSDVNKTRDALSGKKRQKQHKTNVLQVRESEWKQRSSFIHPSSSSRRERTLNDDVTLLSHSWRRNMTFKKQNNNIDWKRLC